MTPTSALDKARALIERLLVEYDTWAEECPLDTELLALAADACDWPECFVCHERKPLSQMRSVQTEATVMHTRNGDGYPGAWDYMCDNCAEKDGDA